MLYTYGVETRTGVVVLVRKEWCKPINGEPYIIREKALAIPLEDLPGVVNALDKALFENVVKPLIEKA
jgi:hypothetical protein